MSKRFNKPTSKARSALLAGLCLCVAPPLVYDVEGQDLVTTVAGSPRQHRRVREAAAGNPVCPVALMAAFATQAVSVRTRLSKNPALPASVGQQLAQVERARLQAGWDVRTSDATGARAVHGRSGRGLRTRQHIWRRR